MSCPARSPIAQSLWTALAISLFLGGCATPPPYRSPAHWSKTGYEWPPGSGGASKSTHGTHTSAIARSQTRGNSSGRPSQDNSAFSPPQPGSVPRIPPPAPINAPIEEGRKCLRALRKTGVSFHPLSSLKGVENPVEIEGKLGGITFYATDHRPLQMDCRLALALEGLRPVFSQHGLTRARFSGAYSYRRTRSGRLSHHAHGLAIDLHDLEFGSKTLSVERDFARNVGCDPHNPPLNRLACSMRDERLFEEFLTPDYNFDHRDHLHIAVPQKR